MENLMKRNGAAITSIGAVVVALLGWYVASHNVSRQLLPGPIYVLGGALELIESGLLVKSIIVSLRRVFIGWIVGSAIAIPLGLLAGMSQIARAAIDPFIHFFRFVPALALTSLFILWFGIGEASKINLVAYAVAFVVLVSTASGASSINQDKILGAKTLGASRFDLFFRVVLPATFGPIFMGMRLAMANAFLVIVAAEAIAAQEGIGFLIWNSRTFFRTDFMFVGIICFGFLGYISDRLWKLLGQTFLSRYLTQLGRY